MFPNTVGTHSIVAVNENLFIFHVLYTFRIRIVTELENCISMAKLIVA